jgi:outer membrane translocation and assembly module TamA
MGVLLGVMFALAGGSVHSQVATGIRLVDVQFTGDTRLEAVDLRKCAADLKSRIYEGPEWLGAITERVRLRCLQDSGYLRATVRPSSKQLPDKHATHQFAITFDIDAGPQYRVGGIRFSDNRVYSADELRSMLRVASDDIFSPAKIRHGLDQIRSAYIERRYLNVALLPDTSIDDVRHIIRLVIYCDEGKQFP